jgi:hypothetical protein
VTANLVVAEGIADPGVKAEVVVAVDVIADVTVIAIVPVTIVPETIARAMIDPATTVRVTIARAILRRRAPRAVKHIAIGTVDVRDTRKVNRRGKVRVSAINDRATTIKIVLTAKVRAKGNTVSGAIMASNVRTAKVIKDHGAVPMVSARRRCRPPAKTPASAPR